MPAIGPTIPTARRTAPPQSVTSTAMPTVPALLHEPPDTRADRGERPWMEHVNTTGAIKPTEGQLISTTPLNAVSREKFGHLPSHAGSISQGMCVR